MIGVFTRSDHPKGWGSGSLKLDENGKPIIPMVWEQSGTAHGYVVIFIKAHHVSQLERIAKKIVYTNFHGTDHLGSGGYSAGSLTMWFGGKFDWVATLPGNDVNIFPGQYPPHIGNGLSKGDNRMVAWYEAKEVMEALGID